jgi:hypothetical protein
MTTTDKQKVGDVEYFLTVARLYITLPESWIQGETSRDNDTKFCALGAINHAVGAGDDRIWIRACQVLNLAMGTRIVSFNDEEGRKHEEILAAFDRAIAIAHEQGV